MKIKKINETWAIASSGVRVEVPNNAGRSIRCVERCSIEYKSEGAI